MMNFWVPDWSPWNTGFNPAAFPNIVQFDYIKVWSYNLTNDTFEFMWNDDLDTFNTTKWEKSHFWTF